MIDWLWFDWVIVFGVPILTLVIIFYFYRARELELFEPLERKMIDPESNEEVTKVYYKKVIEKEEGEEVIKTVLKEYKAQRIIAGIIGLNIEIIYLVFRFMQPFVLIMNPYTVAKGVWAIGLTITPLPLIILGILVAFYIKRRRGTPMVAIHIPEEKDFSKEDLKKISSEVLEQLKEGSVTDIFIKYLVYSAKENCYKEVTRNPIREVNDEVTKWYFIYPIEEYRRGNLYYEEEEDESGEKAIIIPVEDIKRVFIKKTRERAEIYVKPFKFKGYIILKELIEENDFIRRKNTLTIAKELQRVMGELVRLMQLYDSKERSRAVLIADGIADGIREVFLKEEAIKKFIDADEIIKKVKTERAVQLQIEKDSANRTIIRRGEEE